MEIIWEMHWEVTGRDWVCHDAGRSNQVLLDCGAVKGRESLGSMRAY